MTIGVDNASVPLKTMSANAGRGIATLAAYAMIAGGLGALFGIAAGLVGLGVVLRVDVTSDELTERFTGVKRG
jgi:hypothetical protein